MRNLFFYGSLRHLPLLEIVLGRDASTIETQSLALNDHVVSAVAEGPFPMIEAQSGAQAAGLLVQGLSAQDIDRLDFYEGSFAYDLLAVKLADGQGAEVYFPQAGLWTPRGPWSLGEWQHKWAELSCIAAREVMSYYGRKPREDVAQMFPMIRSRAQARINAVTTRHGSGTFQGKVEIVERTRTYAEFFALDDIYLRHQQFDGTMTETLDRAVFIATDAALVLPYDPVRDRVLLVEQMRMGPLARGDRTLWQLEPIAGRIDAGESPEACARREAREEAGLTLGALEPVAEVYASPGTSTEFYYIYVGIADLPDTVTGTGGLDAEHEDIRSHLLSFDALMDLVDTLSAANAPLVLAAFWLARHRDRLRSLRGGAKPEVN
ncbi:nudix-type nucleoside diphosphatase, YffH/AdpP family [Sulfitobacter brevis]|uniref:ADP-ribose pyrophosphatase n=1 Tax=Sulfitobacter brevis TaxID=74348 RepID=A0A1I1UAG0_9RHOB|nr:NUDIX domain-containing protein [Sulfitobacter brevis]SFD67851.1 nudix-type nucleoside diphosphatase, YffH/AdpP family [Sulfitobacter brevis]